MATRPDGEVVGHSGSVVKICRYTKLYIIATTENDLSSLHWRNLLGHSLIEPTTEA